MRNNRKAREEMRGLTHLLRLSLKGPLQHEGQSVTGKGEIVLSGPGGKISFPNGILTSAIERGLVVLNGDVVSATVNARSALRRYLADAEDAFLRQHGDVVEAQVSDGGKGVRVQVNLDHSPLSSLARLKDRSGALFLPREALAAGERLHADFTRGQLQPRITQSFEPRLASLTKGLRGGKAELSDSAMSARIRVTKALDAIGPELSGVALDVCCFMKGLETVERERQWPARSAKLMLRTALLSLHRHYEPPRRANTRSWGDEGYRPEI